MRQLGHTRPSRLKDQPANTFFSNNNDMNNDSNDSNTSNEANTNTISNSVSATTLKKCPGCKTSLTKLLRQQGAGGWKSIATHLSKCRLTLGRARTLTQVTEIQILELERLAKEQCEALAETKAASRAAQREQRASSQAVNVPWFVARQPHRVQEPKLPNKCCSTCGAQFSARDEVSFSQHSERCQQRRDKQLKYHEFACEATAEKAAYARNRVTALRRVVESAKAALERTKQSVEDQKRLKRLQQGKKNKTLKKHAYSLVAVDDADESEQVSIHGCMQRLRDAEKELRAGTQRAAFREQTAEIVKAAAEGVEHPMVQRRAADSRQKKAVNKQVTYRKEQKCKTKDVKACERKEKSLVLSKRRAGADSKMARANVMTNAE